MRDFSIICLDQFEWHWSNIQTNKAKYSGKDFEAIGNKSDNFICVNKKKK